VKKTTGKQKRQNGQEGQKGFLPFLPVFALFASLRLLHKAGCFEKRPNIRPISPTYSGLHLRATWREGSVRNRYSNGAVASVGSAPLLSRFRTEQVARI
jgi:hypothetical protein